MNTDEVYLRQRKQLLSAFGELVEGGIVEGIQHIGSTSVPGMAGSGCVDIGLCIWPFPVDKAGARKLARFGFFPTTNSEDGSILRYTHSSGEIQLFVTAAGSEAWTDFLLQREYLRHNPLARSASDAVDVGWEVHAARAWHVQTNGFIPLQAALEELQGLTCPWHISSGWSIDLFLGRVTRVHHDVDVVIARDDQLTVQRYMVDRGWRWVTPHENQLKPWPEAMKLELPRHQAHCHSNGAMFDFLISEIDHGIWRFRRDLSVLRAMDRLTLRSDSGIPFMAPEATLLYKSKQGPNGCRPKDHTDFLAVHGRLDPERRAWLRWALLSTQPDHTWIEMLK